MNINTGAGTIILNPPIVIGYIVPDIKGVTCDDSCDFAFDQICEDSSSPNHGVDNTRIKVMNFTNKTTDDGWNYAGEKIEYVSKNYCLLFLFSLVLFLCFFILS